MDNRSVYVVDATLPAKYKINTNNTGKTVYEDPLADVFGLPNETGVNCVTGERDLSWWFSSYEDALVLGSKLKSFDQDINILIYDKKSPIENQENYTVIIPSPEGHIFTVTTLILEEKNNEILGRRCHGFFWSKEKATHVLRENLGDMFEGLPQVHIVVEKLYAGLYPRPEQELWFLASLKDNGKYTVKSIVKPKMLKNLVLFSI